MIYELKAILETKIIKIDYINKVNAILIKTFEISWFCD